MTNMSKAELDGIKASMRGVASLLGSTAKDVRESESTISGDQELELGKIMLTIQERAAELRGAIEVKWLKGVRSPNV